MKPHFGSDIDSVSHIAMSMQKSDPANSIYHEELVRR